MEEEKEIEFAFKYCNLKERNGNYQKIEEVEEARFSLYFSFKKYY